MTPAEAMEEAAKICDGIVYSWSDSASMHAKDRFPKLARECGQRASVAEDCAAQIRQRAKELRDEER